MVHVEPGFDKVCPVNSMQNDHTANTQIPKKPKYAFEYLGKRLGMLNHQRGGPDQPVTALE